MKAILQHAISLFRQGITSFSGATSEGSEYMIISGYSNPFDCDKSVELDRKPAGILYADIAEYSRLTELDEEGTHRRLVESMSIMKDQVAAHGGRIAHSAGDAILAEFRDADSALRCAIKVQLAAQHLNADLGLERQVRFRIGVNFGEVISDQGDIYGKAVNLAARLENLACSGGICVSDSVMSMLDDSPSYKFVALGKQYVRNIRRPVKAFWIEIDSQQFIDSECTGAVKVSPMNHE